MIKAVIFDFDGVIGDTMTDNYIAWKNAFKKYDLDLQPLEYYLLEGMGRFQVARHFIEKYQLDPVIENEVVEAKELNYKLNNTFRFYPEIELILSLLKQKGIATAIVTGASRMRITEQLTTAIKEQITTVITADDVKNSKPDPEPYTKAVSELNLNPADCLVVENAALGIQSAKAAGCSCFAIETTLDKSHLGQSDKTFKNHHELLLALSNMLSLQ